MLLISLLVNLFQPSIHFCFVFLAASFDFPLPLILCCATPNVGCPTSLWASVIDSLPHLSFIDLVLHCSLDLVLHCSLASTSFCIVASNAFCKVIFVWKVRLIYVILAKFHVSLANVWNSLFNFHCDCLLTNISLSFSTHKIFRVFWCQQF